MQKSEILIILLVGMIPLLWYTPGYIIARGDFFPYVFAVKNLSNDFYLWSASNLGNPSPMPGYAIYGLLWAILGGLFTHVDLIQIILYSVQFIVAAFSMFYFTKTVYPKKELAPTVASVFYVFNLFLVLILLNLMTWTYAFLPLLLALFTKTITQLQNTLKHVVCFAVTFAVAASISGVNPANTASIIICLTTTLLYYGIFKRKIPLKSFARNLAILVTLTFLVSVFWIVPILNTYMLSPATELQQEVDVVAWSWTHVRASFLNLFWLNGEWGWRTEYYPYYNAYSTNPILSFLVFVPFLLASAALLFKDENRQFNAYFMLSILVFIFLAKGLHEPLGIVNLCLYKYIPYMNMFREPASKFTLVFLPFLSLLIGFSTHEIANTLSRLRLKGSGLYSKIFVAGVIIVFVATAFPLLTNPIEAKTEPLPYSTYVKPPRYWYETSEWLANQLGDFRILITPPDDFYMMPYSWGYYGADVFMERLITKPIVTNLASYSYVVNPDVARLTNEIREMIKYKRVEEFEFALKLLNVKYILQRNDLDYVYITSTGRDVVTPEKMRSFLLTSSKISLAKTIGKLDIYEFADAQPYLHILQSKPAQEYKMEMWNRTVLDRQWNFDSVVELDEWKETTPENQFGAQCSLHLEDSELKFELWNSTWGWKTIGSPLVPAQYEAEYSIKFSVEGKNAQAVHVKVLEYDGAGQITNAEYVFYVADGTFKRTQVQLNYNVKYENTTWLQLQLWNGHETQQPFPNTIWIDNVDIQGHVTNLNTTNIQQALETSTEALPAKIMEYEKLDPTKITAEINSSEPFILTINEAYDPHWKARVNGEIYNSVPIFSTMNGFQIDKTGQLEIVIEYEPQRWFYISSAVSLITLVACIAYMTYRHPKVRVIFRKKEERLGRLEAAQKEDSKTGKPLR